LTRGALVDFIPQGNKKNQLEEISNNGGNQRGETFGSNSTAGPLVGLRNCEPVSERGAKEGYREVFGGENQKNAQPGQNPKPASRKETRGREA